MVTEKDFVIEHVRDDTFQLLDVRDNVYFYAGDGQSLFVGSEEDCHRVMRLLIKYGNDED